MPPHKPLTLIQLVSEQTMQNLLPVLRLKPDRLVHLATPKTASRSVLVADAARQAGHAVFLETITLSTMPTMKETNRATSAAIEREGLNGCECVVNFTGGTKLMSIGAWFAASKYKTLSMYVDTLGGAFMDGQTAPGLEELMQEDLSFTPILQALTVHCAARANGCSRVSNGREWAPLLPLASHLFANPVQEEAIHENFYGSDGIFQGVGEPRKPAQWLEHLDRDIPVSQPVAQLAVEAGLFRGGDSPETIRFPDQTREELQSLAEAEGPIPHFSSRSYAATAPLQHAMTFMTGGWWEIIIANRMQQCGRFRDLRWSVNIGGSNSGTVEEDIVALDGVNIVYVSCKRSAHKNRTRSHLDEIRSRAQAIGGRFTRIWLALYKPPHGQTQRNIEARAMEFGISLIYPENFESPELFQ